MEVNIDIGPYVLKQRTEYSKLQVFDRNTNENVLMSNPDLAEKLISDYYKQTENPEYFFEVKDDKLLGLNGSYIGGAEGVFLPDYIKEIDEVVFEEMPFRYIHLPKALTTINNYAFNDCSQLKYIDLPNTVSKIGVGVFRDCTNLKVAKLSSALEYISVQLFSGCSSLENICIPESVETIRSYAFRDCKNLKNVILSKNVKTLEGEAFAGCYKLENINLPDGLKSINNSCFAECLYLKNINIPNSVAFVGPRVFSGCGRLEHIKLSNSLLELSSQFFICCTELKNLYIPDNISKIGDGIFVYTEDLKEVNLPKEINCISSVAFSSSSVEVLHINHDINEIMVHEPSRPGFFRITKCGIFEDTKINTLTIDGSVKKINPALVGTSGYKITKINYTGNEKEFNIFKAKNRELFDALPYLKEVNFLEKTFEDKSAEKQER